MTKSIAVCIPMGGSIPSKFFIDFIDRLGEWTQKYNITILTETGPFIAKARSDLVQKALQSNVDYIFFLDSDISLQENAIDKLIESDKDIVSGIYYEKNMPFYPTYYKKMSDVYYKLDVSDISDVSNNKRGNSTNEVDGVGFGCVLIKSRVFKNKKMEFPWFRSDWFNNNGTYGMYGEDMYFCNMAKKVGYKIYINTEVKCGHIGGTIYPEVYELFKEQMQKLDHDMKEREAKIKDAAKQMGISDEEMFNRIGAMQVGEKIKV